MHDANDLVRAMQQVSNGTNQAGTPADVMSGTVISAKPLKVKVEQRFDIGSEQLIVPERLTDHKVKITVSGDTGMAGDPKHKHEYGGELTITVHGGLKVSDKVILIRQQGGQKFFIADRM